MCKAIERKAIPLSLHRSCIAETAAHFQFQIRPSKRHRKANELDDGDSWSVPMSLAALKDIFLSFFSGHETKTHNFVLSSLFDAAEGFLRVRVILGRCEITFVIQSP